MGLDSIDIVLRLERRFGIHLGPDDLAPLCDHDATAGELFEVVSRRLRADGRIVPRSSWNRVRLELAECLGVNPLGIRRDQRLAADLGMR